MSKLLTAVLAAVFAVVTVSPVAFAQEMKKEEMKAKTETKKKAPAKTTQKKAPAKTTQKKAPAKTTQKKAPAKTTEAKKMAEEKK